MRGELKASIFSPQSIQPFDIKTCHFLLLGTPRKRNKTAPYDGANIGVADDAQVSFTDVVLLPRALLGYNFGQRLNWSCVEDQNGLSVHPCQMGYCR